MKKITRTVCRKDLSTGILRSKPLVVAFLAVFAFEALSKDIEWRGWNDGKWDTETANWTTTGSDQVKFANNDSVKFTDDYQAGMNVVTIDDAVYPKNIEFDIDSDMTLGATGTWDHRIRGNVESFVKRGAGTLFLDYPSVNNANDFVCGGIDIYGGLVAAKNPNFPYYWGQNSAGDWIRVHDGGAVLFMERGQFRPKDNDYENAYECYTCVELGDGGKLCIATNTPNNWVMVQLNTLKFCGGDILIGNNNRSYYSNDKGLGLYGSKTMVTLRITDKLHFSGSTPHAFGVASQVGYKGYTKSATMNDRFISLNSHKPVEICVDEITGDDTDDLLFNTSMLTWGTNTVGVYACDFVKTGPGSMVWSGTQNATSTKFLGNVTVSGGTLTMMSQNMVPQGDEYADIARTITVSNDAALVLTTRNAIQSATNANVRLEVDGGTFSVRTSSADAGRAAVFSECVFNNATIDISNPGLASHPVGGILSFNGPVSFSGSRPYVLDVDDSIANICQAITVFNNPRTTFNVADITGDGASDVTIGLDIFGFATNASSAVSSTAFLEGCGFIKDGAGTLRITSRRTGVCAVQGPVDVSNGVLCVDGVLTTPSAINVAGGAFIGGTGTVANVNLEIGAGFAATMEQASPLTVQGNLSLPEIGHVEIVMLGGMESSSDGRASLVTATGTLSGEENLANWIVTVNGEKPEREWKLRVKNGVVEAKIVHGLVISYR